LSAEISGEGSSSEAKGIRARYGALIEEAAKRGDKAEVARLKARMAEEIAAAERRSRRGSTGRKRKGGLPNRPKPTEPKLG
jgi:ferritin-like metal-binding protein YciE